ncbi:MAG: hypothetical protein Kow0069_24920 [Promethearchaeota archaeon]
MAPVDSLPQFSVDVESWFFTVLTSGATFLYAWLMLPIVRGAFKKRHEQRWNALALLLMDVSIGVILLVPTAATGLPLVHPLGWFFVVWCAFWVVMYFAYARYVPPSKKTLAPPPQISKFTLRAEATRKSLHVLALLFLIPYSLSNFVFHYIWNYVYPPMAALSGPGNTANVQVIASNPSMLVAHAMLVFILLCTFTIQADAEIVRLTWPNVNFPLRKTLHRNKRRSEVDGFAAHVYMSPAVLLGLLLLTWSPRWTELAAYCVVGVVLVTVFADMAAALVGRKWGNHKWRWLPNKSYEGSLAGMATSFACTVWFVGPLVAAVAALVFLFTDVPLSKLELSDNWTTPLFLSLAFFLLLPWVSPVATLQMVPPPA